MGYHLLASVRSSGLWGMAEEGARAERATRADRVECRNFILP
jgi:hypothetical protein